MYFKKIEMHGFKSFAEPVVIEFDKGITGIVGPNGSGKSNISDAIRWVLGEQSPKMLRGGKMEEVIFSGTDSRKSRGMAEVTLVIDNEKGVLPIDYKEVALTRCMYRSGESEYRINGNQCRLRDIRDLIMDTGIGVDGYSIIGQGKISDILSNKTESRREIFEEAAGIVAYRTKKAESERKLSSTSANMERVSDIIGELQGRIGGLKEDSGKAKEYLKLRDKYKELEINITLKNIENLELKNEYIKDDIAELQIAIDDCDKKRKSIEDNLKAYGEKNDTLENVSNQTQEKLLAAIDDLNATVNKGQMDSQRLSSIEENTERLKREIQALAVKKDKEFEAGQEYENKKEDISKELFAAENALREKIEKYNSAADELAALTALSDKCRNDIFELSSSISTGKAEINSLERLQETLDRREKSLIQEKMSGQDSNKETLDKLNRIKSQSQSIREELDEMRISAHEERKSFKAKQERERILSKEAEEIRISLGRISARVKTIEEMESNYEGYNYAVKHVMKSSLKGINGVVADLIKVPEGYETAIETAMGASLQNIVCEDDVSAKAAIESLKANRAGRMTFLPLTSVKGKASKDRRVETKPGFIGFGPECLSYDKKYQGIIDYLLGRVVIVDNMDNAIKMSKSVSEFRFVTLDGDVINARGAMTGGRYRNKTANILDRKAEIVSLKNEILSKQEQREKQERELKLLREDIAEFTSKIAAIESDIRSKEQQAFSVENELKLTEAILNDIRSGSDKLDKELKNIDIEKENSAKMIDDIKVRLEESHIAMKEAERSGEETNRLYTEKKENFEAVSEEITKAKIDANSCENRKAHIDSMVERINENMEEIEQDMLSRQQQLESLQAEREQILSNSGQNDKAIREKEEEKHRLEEYLTEVNEEKADAVRNITALNLEKEEINNKLSKIQGQKYELEIKNAKNETQLDTYKNKLWEDFEVSYIQAMEFKNDDFVMSVAVKENKQIKRRIRELGEVNVGAIKEYETVKERYDFLVNQRADIQEAVDSLNKIIDDMDKTIKTKFKESFDRIVINFEKKFKELFGGGHAELRLSDENDPLTSNIDIVAQPPGKRLQNINLLSGGEKTLTAIALMFAVLEAKPTPFCILDEVEAALDDVNIDRFISCLRKFTGIQFALVTHQKATMEHADVLYGVTMPEKGVSKILSLNMDDNFEI